MDSTKSALADVRHRAVYHSAFGIYIIQRIFGQVRTNSDGKVYSVRDIAEQHIMEDLGMIPSLEKWLAGTPIENWMMGKKEVKEVKHIPFETPVFSTTDIPQNYPIPVPPIPDVKTAKDYPDFARIVTID